MKNIFHIFGLIILISSCENDDSINKYHVVKTEVLETNIVEKAVSFSISDCQQQCDNDSGRVIINELLHDTLTLKVGNWMNCSWKSHGFYESFDIKNDTLNIRLDRPFELDENGDKMYTVTDCNCYFLLDIRFSNVSKQPKTILINSKPPQKWRY